MQGPPVLIIGAGAVGTTLAAFFMQAKIPVTFLLRDARAEELKQCHELHLSDANQRHDQRHYRPACITQLTANAPYQWVFFCCKQTGLADLLQQLQGVIPAGARLVSCLNGTSAPRQIAAAFPDHAVEPLTVMFNAQLPKPLHAHLTTKPIVEVGDKTSPLLPVLRETALKTHISSPAAVWGKLLINLNNALGALSHTTFKDLFCDPDLKQMYIALVDEAVVVYRAGKIDYTLPFPLPYPVYRQLILRGGGLPWWIAQRKNGVTADAYPSMVADVRQGKPTEIATLNGAIVDLGKQFGIATPLNAKVVELVQAYRQPVRPDELNRLLR